MGLETRQNKYDAANSLLGVGAVIAPVAGTAIVPNITPALGRYKIKAYFTAGGGFAALDEMNAQIQAPGVVPNTTLLRTRELEFQAAFDGVQTINITVIANATAGVNYWASLVLDRVN